MHIKGDFSNFDKQASIMGARYFIDCCSLRRENEENVEKFADTQRYSLTFYIMVVSLSIVGMLLAAFFPKLFRIDHYQTRAISMEVGLRNSTLAVTIALLIQDLMGDFYSSMFVTTAIYGITMYITGFLMILLYKKILPLDTDSNKQ